MTDIPLQQIVEQSPFSMAVFDKDMHYISVSKKWISDNHLELTDVVGKSHYEVFPNISDDWKAVHQRCLNGAVEIKKDEAFRRDDGSLTWLHWEMHPCFGDNGKVDGIVISSEDISARKSAEERLQNIINSFPMSAAILDVNGIILSVNKAWRQYAEENSGTDLLRDSVGTNYLSVCDVAGIDGDFAANAELAIRSVLSGQSNLETIEYPCHSPTQQRWFIMNVSKLEGADPGAVVSHIDITARMLAQIDLENMNRTLESRILERTEALASSEEKFRNLVSDARDGILIFNQAGQIIFGNHQAEKMFGYSFDELINQRIELLIPINLLNTHITQRDEYLLNTTKKPMDRTGLDLNGRRKDGTQFPVDVALSPSETMNGKIVTAIIRDMTARKKREEEVQFLAKAGQMLTESFNHENALKDMVELTVQSIADGCTVRLFGEDKKLKVAASIHVDPIKHLAFGRLAKIYGDKGLVAPEILEAIDSKAIQIINKLPRIRFSGLHLQTSELKDLDSIGEFNSAIIPLIVRGEVIGVLSLISDNTKRRYEESDIPFLKSIANQLALSIVNVRLYNKAQSSIKLREEILAIVSHDLRSPLTSIQMTGQLLPKIAEDKSKVLKFSEKILSSAYQMKRMIEDLMDFAKIQEGNLSIEMKNEQPAVVVESVFEMMNGQATEKGVQLSREASPKLPVVKYDKQRIVQVLVNLVGNAIKFSRSGGHVHLAAFEFNGGVKFSVTDNGLGISEEDVPKIFDRYWQASRSKTASAGLGLSITKGIIEAHGTQIKVESQLGKGSTFYFVLPVSNETRY